MSDPVTRGFLFADLRDYTAFIEAHGDEVAAALLARYRQLVRDVIERSGGAEIKTEGDSFFIVFPSASGAVGCALAIQERAAAENATNPGQPLQIGIGIHAGETVDADGGYVGSAVNIAARICAQAMPGEVLVSETVRDLTRTRSDVRYVARGRRRLKGIADPVAVYAAVRTDAQYRNVPPARQLRNRRGALLVIITSALAISVVIVLLYGRLPSTAQPTATAAALSSVGTLSSVRARSSASSPEMPGPSIIALTVGDNAILVPIQGGTYQAVNFHRRPIMTIGAGWAAASVGTTYLRLALASRPDSQIVFLWPQDLPADPCALSLAAKPADGTAYLNWMRGQSSLVVGPDVFRVFGAVNAVQVDLQVTASQACQYGKPPYVILQGYGAGAGPEVGFQVAAGSIARAYIFDLPGDTVLAVATAPTSDESGILLPEVEEVLASLSFGNP